MAKNALPLILFGAGALLLAGGKKKRRRKKSAGEVYEWDEVSVKPTRPPAAAAQTSGPSGKAATSEVWKSRQTALAFVAGMKVCNCHPGKVDGIFGPATIAAIIAFQICAGIKPDGKWGPQTDAAMKKMLVDIASGQVKVAQPKISEPIEGPSAKAKEACRRYELWQKRMFPNEPYQTVYYGDYCIGLEVNPSGDWSYMITDENFNWDIEEGWPDWVEIYLGSGQGHGRDEVLDMAKRSIDRLKKA